MELPLDAHSREVSSAVDAWVLLEPNKEGQIEGTGEESATTSRWGHAQGGVLRSILSSWRRTFLPSNVRNADIVLLCLKW